MKAHAIAGRATFAVALAFLLTARPEVPVAGQSDSRPGPEIASGTGLGFVEVDDPDLADLRAASLMFVAEGDRVLVALAECPNELCTHVLRSGDGLAWEVVERLTGWSSGIAWTDSGFLVAQNDFRRGQVLYHSEDGLAWEEIPLEGPDYFEGIASGPGGYLLIGCDRDCERSVLWWSEDGRGWSGDTDFGRRARLTDVATNGTSLVGIADPTLRFSGSRAVALTEAGWVNLDLPLPEGPAGQRGDVEDVAALADGGYVILGVRDSARGVDPILLTSPDGTMWTSTEPDVEPTQPRTRLAPSSIASGSDVTAFDVFLSGPGARERGLDDTSHVVWSMGTQDWQMAALPTAADAVPFVRDILVTKDGRIVAIGSTETDERSRPAAWVASPGTAPGSDTPAAVTGDPVAEDTVSGPGRKAQEQELLEVAGHSTCQPYRGRGDFDPFIFGATAAVQCDRPAPGIAQLAVFRFPDAVSIEEYWAYRVSSIGVPLPETPEICQDGRPGWTAWEHGLALCYESVESGKALVRWTDERTGTYWLADANHDDLDRLARWWRDRS